MQNKIEIVNKQQTTEINIEGTIGVPEEWQFDKPEERVSTYEKFRNALRDIAGIKSPEVIVNVRSSGGDVNDALLIHDALTALPAHITTRCYGYTASAATLIAQAASDGRREISANALYLIHNASCAAEGNAEEFAARLDLLRQTDRRLAALYASRSGRPEEEFAVLMAENNGNGRWLSPEEAIAAGLADRVIKEPTTCNYTVIDESENTLIQKSMIKIKNVYGAILRRLNAVPQDENAETEITEEQLQTLNTSLEHAESLENDLQAERTAHEATRGELRDVRDEVQTLQSEIARMRAQPTPTKPVEDPPITDEAKLDGNAKSYAEDVKNFS